MKGIRELDFYKNIRQIREFEFGVFYFFDCMVISEIKEGFVFHWEYAEKSVMAAKEFYGNHTPIIYISNRVNNYSLDAADWVKFYKNRHQLAHYAVVGQTQNNLASIFMKRMFFKNSILQFENLEDAIHWAISKSDVKSAVKNINFQ